MFISYLGSQFSLSFTILPNIVYSSFLNNHYISPKKKKKKRYQKQTPKNLLSWVNYKLNPWSFGFIGFYTPKFLKFYFTPWSLVSLTIHPPRLVSTVKWHIIMLCVLFCQISLKTTSFQWWPRESWHNQNYVIST